jgi:hypothetical protein
MNDRLRATLDRRFDAALHALQDTPTFCGHDPDQVTPALVMCAAHVDAGLMCKQCAREHLIAHHGGEEAVQPIHIAGPEGREVKSSIPTMVYACPGCDCIDDLVLANSAQALIDAEAMAVILADETIAVVPSATVLFLGLSVCPTCLMS